MGRSISGPDPSSSSPDSRGFVVEDFDVSPDGRDIIFDRTREESEIVRFDWPAR